MSQQLQQAVEIAYSSTAEPALKKQALEYVQNVKAGAGAAEVFVGYLGDAGTSDVGRFVALQALSELAGEGGPARLAFLKDSAMRALRGETGGVWGAPEYVRNKTAEWVSRLFYAMYGEVNGNMWNSFFEDVAQATGVAGLRGSAAVEYNAAGLDAFLRVCAAINSEIGDQTFVRSKDAQVKNNSLKDAMRVQDVATLTSIWRHALEAMRQDVQRQDVAVLVLQCIGSFISWIDINLIVNSEYISTIYAYLNYPKTRIACAQCLCEILSKKMKPGDKLQLLGMLSLTDKVLQLGDVEVEVHEQLAKLTSSVGLELSVILEQCHDDSSSAGSCSIANSADHQIIHQVAPLVLKFMNHEYDSVTQQTFPFISHYLTFLKRLFALGGKPGSAVALNSKKLPLDDDHRQFLTSLIIVCMNKMKFDETCSYDDEDEVEEFVETVRSKLKVFQDNIAVINPAIYMENISKHIKSLLLGNSWRDLELAIYQMHNFAESIRNNLFGLNKSAISQSQPAQLMTTFMQDILDNSAIFQSSNPLIQISFFELIVRHYNFISHTGKNDISILSIFCTPFSMFNDSEKVRLRSWYLFSRLIKVTKPRLDDESLSQLLSKLAPLLAVKLLPNVANDSEIDTTFDNQLYIFEGVGILIGAKAKEEYSILDGVLSPLFADLESCIAAPVKSPEIVVQAHHILMAIGTIARGVHAGLVPENQLNNPQVNAALVHKSLIEKFSNIAEVILVTFSYFNKYETIRDATRFSFARLTPILKNDIIPFSSRLISIFLESDLKTIEMNDFLGFLGQMVHTFHADDNCYQLFNNLFTPVIKKVFDLVAQVEQEGSLASGANTAPAVSKVANGKNVVITDSFRDKVQLKKAYYSFLQSFVSNNVTSLLLTTANRNILPLILSDLLSYTPAEIHETSSMKLSLNVLINFVKFFGTGRCADFKDRNANTFEPLEGLSEFFITKVVPLVFEIPFKPEYEFNIDDGSCLVLAADLSRLLKALYDVNGDPANNASLKYLTEAYFPQVQFPQELSMEFIQTLATADEKAFEKYFVSFIKRMRS
ncbi:AFR424Cp [Eremothecium gossypii ATCC 10895]|uniref:Exportin-T n=1 Tax=Eremothecium gossypii (strain ATCC 10895 / CBS 109.51 / FGSC 9923 / NRRL Y-1056) TaxID=284811 RepID=XPOT_EREGS|nr:AFR424Cp [Eremothecium gossypii ATCC 10895]Q753A0.2 RecName: Full=Exportin-T; AltName: Full=Exportin(tRNA); AltName: Full=Karyopherin-beta; AltName: Full=tRNA exportin [Eremothecium gossypii ATCC 10895]AAS53795.2 AFR424Cp [Eremothecium gossypii ATCC 10895]AEY98107.1 FAFR424Cp [Eremothecium gossypii FDAG1]